GLGQVPEPEDGFVVAPRGVITTNTRQSRIFKESLCIRFDKGIPDDSEEAPPFCGCRFVPPRCLRLMPVNTSAQGGNYSFMNIDYPGADFTSVGGINDSAAVVGYYFGGDGVVHGFLYNGTAYSDLDYPGSSATGAAGINNSGVITGYHDDAGGTHGFLDNQGSFSSFDCPGVG